MGGGGASSCPHGVISSLSLDVSPLNLVSYIILRLDLSSSVDGQDIR